MLMDHFAETFSLLAGMPSITLNELVRMRLQTISFFLVCVLASAGLVCGLWSGLRRDFAKLPRLRYRAALFGTVLWGLLFLLVLTMISGARELLTPGAWQKTGLTYQLAEPTESDVSSADHGETAGVTLAERELGLGQLYRALLPYAAVHDSRFPDDLTDINERARVQPGKTAIQYGYLPGMAMDDAPSVIAFEHQIYGDDTQLALFSDGEIRPIDADLRDQILRSRQDPWQTEPEAGL